MPAKYEAIRDKLQKGGMELEAAKKHAAMIYNAQRKPAPVTRGTDAKAKKR